MKKKRRIVKKTLKTTYFWGPGGVPLSNYIYKAYVHIFIHMCVRGRQRNRKMSSWIHMVLTHLPPRNCPPRADKARSGKPSRKRTSSRAARSRGLRQGLLQKLRPAEPWRTTRGNVGTSKEPEKQNGQPGSVERKCTARTFLRHAVVIC